MKTSFVVAVMTFLPCLLAAETGALAMPTRGESSTASLRQALTKVENHRGVGGNQATAMTAVQAKTAAGYIASAAAVRNTSGSTAPMLRKLPFSPIARQSGPSGSSTRIGFTRAGVTWAKQDVYSKTNPSQKIGTEKTRVAALGFGKRSTRTTQTSEGGVASTEREDSRSRSTPFNSTQRSTTTSTHVHQGGSSAHVEIKTENGDNSHVGIYARSSATARVTEPRTGGGHDVQTARAEAKGSWTDSHASVKVVSEKTN